jgi:hypothetical protein
MPRTFQRTRAAGRVDVFLLYAFLRRDRTREWFCEALAEARSKLAYQLRAYVFMPAYVHVFVYPGDAPEQMSAFLQAVKEPVARKAI